MDTLKYFVIIIHLLRIDGASVQEQLEHVSRRQQESYGRIISYVPMGNTRRKYFQFDPHDVGSVIGAPSLPMHLPAAEPILPGHTLIRPALGMLKSSVKFPHREMDNGAGVYGNYNNLGIRYDGRNERVKYTDFRRSGTPSASRRSLADYIMVVPSKPTHKVLRPGFSVMNLPLDMERKKDAELRVLNLLEKIRQPVKNDVRLIVYLADPQKAPLYLQNLYNVDNNEIDIKEQLDEPQKYDNDEEEQEKSDLIQILPDEVNNEAKELSLLKKLYSLLLSYKKENRRLKIRDRLTSLLSEIRNKKKQRDVDYMLVIKNGNRTVIIYSPSIETVSHFKALRIGDTIKEYGKIIADGIESFSKNAFNKTSQVFTEVTTNIGEFFNNLFKGKGTRRVDFFDIDNNIDDDMDKAYKTKVQKFIKDVQSFYYKIQAKALDALFAYKHAFIDIPQEEAQKKMESYQKKLEEHSKQVREIQQKDAENAKDFKNLGDIIRI